MSPSASEQIQKALLVTLLYVVIAGGLIFVCAAILDRGFFDLAASVWVAIVMCWIVTLVVALRAGGLD